MPIVLRTRKLGDIVTKNRASELQLSGFLKALQDEQRIRENSMLEFYGILQRLNFTRGTHRCDLRERYCFCYEFHTEGRINSLIHSRNIVESKL